MPDGDHGLQDLDRTNNALKELQLGKETHETALEKTIDKGRSTETKLRIELHQAEAELAAEKGAVLELEEALSDASEQLTELRDQSTKAEVRSCVWMSLDR